MRAYTVFAHVYDIFMRDIPYERWCNTTASYMKNHGVTGGKILELGCGTGSFTMLMSEKGYEMTGIDMSQDMLYEAKRKNRKAKLPITYMQQDMRALELDERFDAVLSVCDSINYMENNFDMQSAFKCAGDALKDGGIFIFDMKTPSYYERLGNQVFTDSTQEGTYVWENDYDSGSRDNNYYITFFIKKRHDLYRKYTEEHTQHAFTDEDVQTEARNAGLCVCDVLGEDMRENADWNAERVYYVMKRR